MNHAPKDIETLLRDKFPEKTPQAIKVMMNAWEHIRKEILRLGGTVKTKDELTKIIEELR